MFRVIARNAASNWMGFVVQAVVAFVLTPFVLRSLGATEYGLWTLIIGLTGYYGLLDLGFRAGLTQYLTRYLATGDTRRLNGTASTGVVVLAGIGGLILLATLGLATAAPVLFHLPAGSEQTVWWAIVINGCAIAVQFPLFPFSAVFAATQRYDLSTVIGIVTRLGTALATYLCLVQGCGLVGLSLTVAGGNLVDYALRWVVAYRILPALHISPRLASLRSCWEFMHYGLWNVLIAGSNRLLLYSGEILIGLFLPAEAITAYALAACLINYFVSLFIPIGTVFFPVATELDAQNRRDALRDMYLLGSQMLLMLALPLGLLACFWVDSFFRLWLGADAQVGLPETAAGLFRLLMIGALFNASQRVSYQVLLGTRRVRVLAVLFACEALANLALTVCLIPWLGVYGVPVGAAAPALLFQAVVHPYVVGRALRVSGRTYLRKVVLRPLAVGSCLAVALAFFRLGPGISSWPELLFQGGLGGALTALLIAGFGLTADQRERFLLRPLRKALPARAGPTPCELVYPVRPMSGDCQGLPAEAVAKARVTA